jgi:N-acetylglucosaminyldiphosphoundecaprenol N-acetyl-beta-D-mannosaminyltransferase
MSNDSADLFGISIHALSWEQAVSTIMQWTQETRSRVVCACNVHSVISAKADSALKKALKSADMRTPDGAPLAWLMRKIGWPTQQRINGPDLMWKLLSASEQLQIPVFLLGSTESTLNHLEKKLCVAFPKLRLVGQVSPPFRTLTAKEDDELIALISSSGARILFVGLGCPKQEKWMATHRQRLPMVMVGVGAAFDYHAGTLARAPIRWQRAGLEWLYRLAMEPKRLGYRYLVTNTLFLLALPGQLWRRPR